MQQTIWQIKDGKKGHENQSSGLIQALAKLVPIETVEIDIQKKSASWFDYARGRLPLAKSLPKPDLIIGAGSQTHSTILAAGRVTRAPTVVMMAPPRGISKLFGRCIVPEHDHRAGPNIIGTKGVLNRIKISTEKKANQGLFLIGGPSKHHSWDASMLRQQLKQILELHPQTQWTATTSRRSPAQTSATLSASKHSNLHVVPVEQTHGNWLSEQLNQASLVWVTEDSVSMIYEALSSGAKVGVLQVPRKTKHSRVIRGIDQLITEGAALRFDPANCNLATFPQADPLDEAARVAQIIFNDYLRQPSSPHR